ncbi:SDR family oxidoreductase, partial [Streptomyces thioluteus]|uniref:SDR family oxidoreductase n=1 Tax=Streptomyces thioluteus TaxID=66431 RepID=UPI003CD06C99
MLLSSSSVLVPDPAADPIARGHWAAEQALAASPITSTFLRPGAFATNALAWPHALRATGTVRLPVPDAHADPIHERDLAEAALAVLTDPEPRGGAPPPHRPGVAHLPGAARRRRPDHGHGRRGRGRRPRGVEAG